MGFVINNNLAANNTYRNLNNTQTDLSKSLEKLSSGLRINRAGDDAAGLSISEGLKSQVTGSAQAARNAQDGISVIQTAEGALTEVHSILQRVRDLAVQAGNDSNNTDSRAAITAEATSLAAEVDRIDQSTNFNGIKLLDGSAGAGADGKMSFQVGAGSSANDKITVDLGPANLQTAIKTALTDHHYPRHRRFRRVQPPPQRRLLASTLRSRPFRLRGPDLGASQNRLEHTIKS